MARLHYGALPEPRGVWCVGRRRMRAQECALLSPPFACLPSIHPFVRPSDSSSLPPYLPASLPASRSSEHSSPTEPFLLLVLGPHPSQGDYGAVQLEGLPETCTTDNKGMTTCNAASSSASCSATSWRPTSKRGWLKCPDPTAAPSIAPSMPAAVDDDSTGK